MRRALLVARIALYAAILMASPVGSPVGVDDTKAQGQTRSALSMDFRMVPGEHLLAFVGRKIDVREVPRSDPRSLDAEFRARYEILDVVYGVYPQSEIVFTAFDHYGYPRFARYETVLLYVSPHEGAYYHQKYLFQPVYRTADRRWAGCGDPYSGMPIGHRHGVRAEPVPFSSAVKFSVSGLTEAEIAARYPAPYFVREGDAMRCVHGNYPDELFRVMAEGFLSARGILRRAPAVPHNEPLQPDGASPRR